MAHKLSEHRHRHHHHHDKPTYMVLFADALKRLNSAQPMYKGPFKAPTTGYQRQRPQLQQAYQEQEQHLKPSAIISSEKSNQSLAQAATTTTTSFSNNLNVDSIATTSSALLSKAKSVSKKTSTPPLPSARLMMSGMPMDVRIEAATGGMVTMDDSLANQQQDWPHDSTATLPRGAEPTNNEAQGQAKTPSTSAPTSSTPSARGAVPAATGNTYGAGAGASTSYQHRSLIKTAPRAATQPRDSAFRISQTPPAAIGRPSDPASKRLRPTSVRQTNAKTISHATKKRDSLAKTILEQMPHAFKPGFITKSGANIKMAKVKGSLGASGTLGSTLVPSDYEHIFHASNSDSTKRDKSISRSGRHHNSEPAANNRQHISKSNQSATFATIDHHHTKSKGSRNKAKK